MHDVHSLVRLVDRAPVPDLWSDIQSRMPGRVQPAAGPGRRTAAAVIGLAIAAIGFVFVYAAVRPDDARQGVGTPTSTTEPDALTGEPTITARIPVPEDLTAYDIAVGAGAAWVALDEGILDDGGGGVIGRIDPETNEITAQIPVERSPYRDQIAATDGAVWVASGEEILRIDPATNEIVARVAIGDRFAAAVAADETATWVLASSIHSGNPAEWTGSLVRIDPISTTIVADIPLGSFPVGYHNELRLGAGSVWLLGVRLLDPGGPEYGSDLVRVDPATNAVAARIPVGGFHMAVGPEEVWVRFPADGVVDSPDDRWMWTRVDVSTGEPSSPFAFEAATVQHDGLRLVTTDALWAVGYDDQDEVRVTSFDPTTLHVSTQSDAIGPILSGAVVDADTRSAWIATGETIVRLDIA
jgi:DNA-binding beta-propeller fold protein YncE